MARTSRALALSQSNASRQLGVLRTAGVVDNRRDGSWVYYRLATQEHEAVARVIDELTRSFAAGKLLRSDLVKLKRTTGPGSCG